MPSSELPLPAPFEGATGKPKLLVVDDQRVNIQILYQAFSGDCQVFMATSGAQALALCQSNPPDLILLDVVMPGMDGFEVCTRLKADPLLSHIPVIFVTAYTDQAQETHGLSVGAVDFIGKPVNPAVVRARVKTHLTLKFQSDLLRRLVFLDGLSGVFNRRYFDQQLATEWARSGRSKLPLSLVMLDVDLFKAYNDLYGHQMGDECLRQVALAIQGMLKRPADLVARYGGEEFACILPETGFADAMAMAGDMEQHLRSLAIPHASSTVAPVVTASFGVATHAGTGGSNGYAAGGADALVRFADGQMYRAKSTGRGTVCGELLA